MTDRVDGNGDDLYLGWLPLGGVAPTELGDARLQLHWSAQVVAAVGKTFISPREDDSHPNFEFVARGGILRGHPTETEPVMRASLAVETAELRVEGEGGKVLASEAVAGKTLDDGFAWLSSAIRTTSGGKIQKPLDRTLYELPEHPVGSGAQFQWDDGSVLRELRCWYHNADRALREFAMAMGETGPIRCWPHHFDIGGLTTLEAGKDPESAKSIGFGMTPGDHYYNEPYWYVNPYPGPDGGGALPDLSSGGRWNQNDWFGAVLTGSDVARLPADQQEQSVREFLRSAYSAALSLLGI